MTIYLSSILYAPKKKIYQNFKLSNYIISNKNIYVDMIPIQMQSELLS